MKFNFIDFEKWLERNPDLIDEENPYGECMTCNGTGECDCHCGDSHDCGVCRGTGFVGSKKARAIYDRECKRAQEIMAAIGAPQ